MRITLTLSLILSTFGELNLVYTVEVISKTVESFMPTSLALAIRIISICAQSP